MHNDFPKSNPLNEIEKTNIIPLIDSTHISLSGSAEKKVDTIADESIYLVHKENFDRKVKENIFNDLVTQKQRRLVKQDNKPFLRRSAFAHSLHNMFIQHNSLIKKSKF